MRNKSEILCDSVTVQQFERDFLDEFIKILSNSNRMNNSVATRGLSFPIGDTERKYAISNLEDAKVFEDNGDLKDGAQYPNIHIDKDRAVTDGALENHHFENKNLNERDRIILDAAIVEATAVVMVKYRDEKKIIIGMRDDEVDPVSILQQAYKPVIKMLSDTLNKRYPGGYNIMSAPTSYQMSDEFRIGLFDINKKIKRTEPQTRSISSESSNSSKLSGPKFELSKASPAHKDIKCIQETIFSNIELAASNARARQEKVQKTNKHSVKASIHDENESSGYISKLERKILDIIQDHAERANKNGKPCEWDMALKKIKEIDKDHFYTQEHSDEQSFTCRPT